ncbi:MAG TPA: YqiA/YcfP family alpha/beta fold hydrolase [Paucimonas sp.]|nr:YqiA/YcfP family alpha/beta fold hydrolase [Paucimonas sp.]
MILYLHGFRSSPLSFKARMIADRLRETGWRGQYECPQLPASPRAAIELAQRIAATVPPQELALIGSSLGGYYATWLAERIGCKAVLLNPAVKPPRDLESYVGVTTAYHSDERFEFKREYIDELKALAVAAISRPERYFLLAATGDEVLDWREMVEHYPHARQRVIDGSDHGISDFADHIDDVLAFCGVPPGSGPDRPHERAR